MAIREVYDYSRSDDQSPGADTVRVHTLFKDGNDILAGRDYEISNTQLNDVVVTRLGTAFNNRWNDDDVVAFINQKFGRTITREPAPVDSTV